MKPYPLALIGVVFFLSCAKEKEKHIPSCDGSKPTYATEIKPVIEVNCTASNCHNSGSKNGDFTNYAGLKKVTASGDFEREVLINQTMPDGNKKLTNSELDLLDCWLKNNFKEKP